MSLSPDAIKAVKEMIVTDKRIAELEAALKKFKERKAVLQKSIFQHMRKNDIKQVNLPGGEKLQTYTRKSRPTCTKKWVQERMQTYCNSHQVNFQELYDYIYDPNHRPQIETAKLKKVKARKSKTKK